MKKFQYRLERVLKYRELLREEKRRSLAELRLELNRATAQLEAFKNEYDSLGLDTQETTSEIFQLLFDYAERLRGQMAQQELLILDLQEKVSQALLEYIEAAKEAESLTKHRQNKRTEYIENFEKEQQKTIDELAIQRIGQKKFESTQKELDHQLSEETL